eukprot:scaffold223076_cov20-Cyclotella_meneghiniana.AAC.1
MFGVSDEEDARLERAATMGVKDAGAFDFSSLEVNSLESVETLTEEDETATVATAADPDAFT